MAADSGGEQTRIVVTTFDAVEQAELWLELGADEATDVLLGALRTAVLLGGEIVLDRNQVLDGVFFLANGPDRLAAELGLPAGARLPMIMTLDHSPSEPWETPVPRLLGTGRGRVDPRRSHVSIDGQLAHVRSERFLTASSAVAAITGGLEGQSWLYPAPTSAWTSGVPLTPFGHDVGRGDFERGRRLVAAAQEAWATAIREGRLAVDLWGGAMDMERARSRILAGLEGSGHPPLAPLADHVLSLRTSVRKDAIAAIDAWRADNAGARIDEEECRLALSLWTRMYYLAIAAKEEALLLTLNVAGRRADQIRLEQYGLDLPVRSWWRRLWDRHTAGPCSDRRRVDGEILDHMRTIEPQRFARLRRQTRSRVSTMLRDCDRMAMYDLALACRDAAGEAPDYRAARRSAFWRAVVMVVVAAVLLLPDIVPDLPVAIRVALVLLSLVVSLPWDTLREERSLHRSQMTAVLNVSEDR